MSAKQDLVIVSFGPLDKPFYVSKPMPTSYWSMCNLKFEYDNHDSGCTSVACGLANMSSVTDIGVAKAIEEFVANRQGIDCTKVEPWHLAYHKSDDPKDFLKEKDVYALFVKLDEQGSLVAKIDASKKPTDLLWAFINSAHTYGFYALKENACCYYAFRHLRGKNDMQVKQELGVDTERYIDKKRHLEQN